MNEDLQKICRTCLDEVTVCRSLFDVQYINEQQQLRLAEVLAAFTSLEVAESDSLPKQVCTQCEDNIIRTFNFQQLCLKSDSVLKAFSTQQGQSHQPAGKIEQSSLESSLQLFDKINADCLKNEISGNDSAEAFVDSIADFSCTPNESGSEPLLGADILLSKENENLLGEYLTQSDETVNIEHKVKEKPVVDETLQPLFPCEAKGCFACFTTDSDLKRHSNIHLPQYKLCNICNTTFSSANTLSRHIASKHKPEKRIHECNECGKSFARSDELTRHTRIHTGEKPYSCEMCGKAFSQSFRLLEHIRGHSNVKNFVCAKCGKGFARYTSLMAHNKTHNPVKSHECPKCGKKLSGPGSLSMHMKMHTGQKDFVCNFCQKQFISASNLIVHKRTHTGERPYSCTTCGKSFPDTSRLAIHTRVHSGIKPYVCSYCGRGFVSSTALKRHVRIHTGERPFSCELCARTFARTEDLKTHIKVHKDERNHICEVCNKGFFQRATLRVHMRIHTGEKPYSCEICNKFFSQRGPYKTHLKLHEKLGKSVQTVESDVPEESEVNFLVGVL